MINLGEKLLAAKVVTEDDVKRVQRQVTIQREDTRKRNERRDKIAFCNDNAEAIDEASFFIAHILESSGLEVISALGPLGFTSEIIEAIRGDELLSLDTQYLVGLNIEKIFLLLS